MMFRSPPKVTAAGPGPDGPAATWPDCFQQLRAAGPAVQALSGFQPAMSFSQGLTRLGYAQRQLYIACLLVRPRAAAV